jgi:fluoride exporter
MTSPESGFPIGTLTINVLGCFFIGLASKIVTGELLRLALITGFLGGFTTFSAFSMETFQLLRNGMVSTAVWYITASNVGGIAAAWAGWQVGKMTS